MKVTITNRTILTEKQAKIQPKGENKTQSRPTEHIKSRGVGQFHSYCS